MDADRFAALLRSVSGSSSRRGALRLLVGPALGSLFTLGTLPTDAKKDTSGKAKGKKKRGSRQNGTFCTNGTDQVEMQAPAGQCVGRDTRCGQGADAICCQAPRNGTATCGSGGSCDFVCNQGYKRCDRLGGSCIPVLDCCTDNDCGGPSDECQRPICDNATGRCGFEYTWTPVVTYQGQHARPCHIWRCGEGGAVQDYEPFGTPCCQDGGTYCDGAGNCVAA